MASRDLAEVWLPHASYFDMVLKYATFHLP